MGTEVICHTLADGLGEHRAGRVMAHEQAMLESRRRKCLISGYGHVPTEESRYFCSGMALMPLQICFVMLKGRVHET